jgi:protease-4
MSPPPPTRMAEAQGDMAKAALQAGLIDKIGDRSDFEARMIELVGADDEDVPGSYKHSTYDAWVAAHPAGNASGEIGVLTVAGNIVDGEARARHRWRGNGSRSARSGG